MQRQDPAFSQLRTEATHLLSTLIESSLPKGLTKWVTTAP
jgi:hypothetical protein